MPLPIHRPNAGKPWAETENETLRHLAGADAHPRMIASALGRPVASVWTQAWKLGVGLGSSTVALKVARQEARRRAASDNAEDEGD